MNILFLTNDGVSQDLIDWLVETAREYVIAETAKLDFSTVQKVNADFLLSYNYPHIIKEDVLNLYPGRAINMHISLLPWNRGADPNFWSIVEDVPKGVTIHNLDKGVDTGDILLQEHVEFKEDEETLLSSYNKLHYTLQKLFKDNWTKIRSSELNPIQQTGEGSVHYKRELAEIKHILGSEGWHIPLPVLRERYKQLVHG